MVDLVECESCDISIEKSQAKSFKRFLVLCPPCYAKESTAISEIMPIKFPKPDDIQSKEQFFNLDERTDIGRIEGTAYEKAIAIRERIDKWATVLFEARVRSNAAYDELIKLATDLRSEEREQVKIASNFTYEPNIVKPKIRAKATSSEDKALLKMASIVFGKQLAMLDQVTKEIWAEHKDWFFNGIVIASKRSEYSDAVMNKGALTEDQAIARIKDVVKNSRAKNFQQLASGERKLSDGVD